MSQRNNAASLFKMEHSRGALEFQRIKIKKLTLSKPRNMMRPLSLTSTLIKMTAVCLWLLAKLALERQLCSTLSWRRTARSLEIWKPVVELPTLNKSPSLCQAQLRTMSRSASNSTKSVLKIPSMQVAWRLTWNFCPMVLRP